MNTPENNNTRTATRADIAATRNTQLRYRVVELRKQVDRLHTIVVFYRSLSFVLACLLVGAAIFL